jgi:transcriptional antiterminator NusG
MSFLNDPDQIPTPTPSDAADDTAAPGAADAAPSAEPATDEPTTAEPTTAEPAAPEVPEEPAPVETLQEIDAAGVVADGNGADPAPSVDPETGEIIDAEDLLEEPPPAESPFDRPGKWFVVHTQSGYEKKVKQNLEARTSSMNMEGRIHEVVIPMEEVVEIRSGKKQVVQKKMFPGYLLVRCELDDESWYVIRNTPGVTGFVGAGNKPSPLPRRDVENFLAVSTEDADLPSKKGRARLEHEMGETVRVKEGPFANFSGEIVEINEDQLKVKVLVDIFGRETPVELDFSQVAKF